MKRLMQSLFLGLSFRRVMQNIDAALIGFMNDFSGLPNIPTDFVYTGKLAYGLFDLIRKSLPCQK